MRRRFVRFFGGRFLCLIAAMLSGFTALAGADSAAFAAEVNRQFTLAPNSSVCFTYPQAGSNAPVQVMVHVTVANSTLTPSAIVSAIVSRDTATGKFSWIGTNGDGTNNASGTGQSVAAYIAAGAGSTFYLIQCTLPGKSNQLELYQLNTIGKFNYYVTMFY